MPKDPQRKVSHPEFGNCQRFIAGSSSVVAIS